MDGVIGVVGVIVAGGGLAGVVLVDPVDEG